MNSTCSLTVEQEVKTDCINEEHNFIMDERNNSLKFISIFLKVNVFN